MQAVLLSKMVSVSQIALSVLVSFVHNDRYKTVDC